MQTRVNNNVTLSPLQADDRDQFICDNQRAFNRCGFHIVEFWNPYHHGPEVPADIEVNWSEEDEMFLFRKIISKEQ